MLPRQSRIHFLAALLGLAGLSSAATQGQDTWTSGRRTLLQWSGSTEEGGPPGYDEPLASDRPDFVEASVTVGRGVRQLEMGYTYFSDDATRLHSHSFPELLYRAGVFADWLELRVGWNFGSLSNGFDPLSRTAAGAEDLYLGVKLGLTGQDGILPEMAIVPQMTVPTGHQAFTSGSVNPGVNWLYGWDITAFLSLGASTQVNLGTDDVTDHEFVEFAQAFTFGYNLAEKVGAYTEWFVLAPAGAETVATEHYLDGGFTFRVTNNLQLDIRAGKGVSAFSINYFVGSGAVVRW